MRSALLFFLCALSLMGTAQPARSQQQRLVVVTEEWPPFRINARGSRHGFSGIDIDVLERLEEELGVRVEMQRHPFARCLQMIRSGEADLTPGIAYTEERAEFIRYVPTSYSAVQPVFYAVKGLGDRVRTYEDLHRYSVGYSLHSAYFEPFNSDGTLNKVGVATEEQLVKMLALGRLDLIVGTNPNLAWDVRRYGLGDQVEQTAYLPPVNTPLYFGVSRSTPQELVERIDRFLRDLLAGGEMERILDGYR